MDCIRIFLARCLLILPLFCFIPPAVAELPSREQAVALARSGKLDEAIRQLELLHRQYPDNEKIIHDLIVVYTWNGQDSQACSLFELQNPESLPFFVQIAAQKAYRDLNQPDQALAIVERLLQQRPDEPDLLLYKGLLFIDKYELKAAHRILDSIRDAVGKDSRYYLLSGYLHIRKEHWLTALSDYQYLSGLQAHDRKSAVVEQFSALRHMLAGEAAGDLLNRHEEWFTRHDKAELLMDRAATRLRLGGHVSADFQETKLLTMQALALQIRALDLLNTDQEEKKWPSRLLNDLVVALHNLRQMEDAEQVYRYLTDQGGAPRYVQLAAAGAMLANRRPDKARMLYQQILDQEPDNYQATVGLFYSFVEEEDFENAYTLIDSAGEKEPLYLHSTGSGSDSTPPYNSRYLDLHVYSITARLYGDQLEEAWIGVDALVRSAPLNTWLREVRGQVAGARGWHRLALRDFHHALLLEPESPDILAAEASALTRLKQYERAEPLLDFLRQTHPDEEAVDKLEEEWVVSRKFEGWADILYSTISGSELHGDRLLATADIVSGPINNRLYAEAFSRYAREKFIEGEEIFRRYSLGMHYQGMDWNFLGQVTCNDSTVDEVGGIAELTWTPDDFRTLKLSGERFSVNTPLRALYHGIRSDVLSADIHYRRSEQQSLSAGIKKTSFTDGNNGVSGTLDLSRRLVDIPHFDLDGRVELYGSVNNRDDPPCFFPERDFSVKGVLHIDHIYHRHYDDSLAQMIDAGFGVYEQKGYGSDWIGHIRYEHLYSSSPWVEILAGVEFARDIYDGNPEYSRHLRLMINWKF